MHSTVTFFVMPRLYDRNNFKIEYKTTIINQ